MKEFFLILIEQRRTIMQDIPVCLCHWIAVEDILSQSKYQWISREHQIGQLQSRFRSRSFTFINEI